MNNKMPDDIYIQLGENRIGTELCLRKWSREPFEDGTKYVRADKAVPEWQPIETAPKMYDKWCIVGHPYYTVCEIAYFNKRHNCWRTSGMSVFIPNGPTHWMPLPQPPKSDSPTFGLNPSGIVVRLFK